ncbi:hypothetical protein MWU78_04290 [Arenibacter sp. F26102]|uniref:hypothetical protein n=1 Tax=Arenibacter sp. F26102 TaxID=2926416 RepID=UPI001FF0F378|nr:hypothetical protein [Arenibacter sp. F26102]MCK0144863.1 hypothetical protein [Arenibacter sp. F26102]
MTHDIAWRNGDLLKKRSSTSITFKAMENDTYFCTVPGHRAAIMLGKFEVVEGELSGPSIAGVIPTKNGKPLNLGFESGSLQDWTAIGDAFKITAIRQRSFPSA